MSGLIRLSRHADITSDQGRGQLDETLILLSNKLRLLEKELGLVKEADKIVRPSVLREFPLASSGIISSTASGAGVVGELVLSPDTTTPAGCLPCDGQTSYSAFDYADLFAIIGYNYGGNPGANTFLTPDLRGRCLIGEGTGSGLTNRAQFSTGGGETHQLTTSEIPSHNHGLNSHTHDLGNHTHAGPSHTHDMTHTHTAGTFGTPAGGGGPGINYTGATALTQYNVVIGGMSTTTTGAGGTGNTGTPSTNTSGAASGNTSNAGSGGSHTNMQPWAAMSIFIRYAPDDASTSQSIPVNWGKVTGTWSVGTGVNTPNAAISNTVEKIVSTDPAPEGTITLTASGASGASGGNHNLTLTGLVRIPYNFRQFRADAFSIRTKVAMTGVDTSSSATVTLKVNDPTAAAGFLSNTYTRTISESSNSIDDGAWVTAELTAEQLTTAWKPGYVFRFELEFSVPLKQSTLSIKVGKLELNWR